MIGVFETDPAIHKYAGKRKLQQFGTWEELLEAARTGVVDTVVVASVSSVARTAGKLHKLLRELDKLAVKLVAVSEGFEGDEVTRKVVAALAQAEVQKRVAGVRVGIEEKKKRVEAGVDQWNFGRPSEARLTPEVKAEIYRMKDAKVPVVKIADTLKLSRQSIYNALKERKKDQQKNG